jgi:DUF2911 family protein
MKHVVALCTALAAGVLSNACASNEPPIYYGYVARLGRDTISVENVTRQGSRLTIDGVDRFPTVRRRHTTVDVAPDGGVRRLVMDIHTPSEPADERDLHVEADVGNGSVHLVKRDASDTIDRTFAARDMIVMAHVPQMYSLYDLYFAAARKHAGSAKADDTVHMRQFYIDREFDRFSMHNATVHLMPGGKAEIWHDWLAGIGAATLDSTGHLVSYSGARTTYKVDVQRITDSADVNAIASAFAATEAKQGGAKSLSVRDTAKATVGNAVFTIDYARPLMRGRVLLGNIIPYDRVWRTGANAATQFSTPVPVTLGNLRVPAGTYTLWTVPRKSGAAELIVNKQTRQWGTEYDARLDLGTTLLRTTTVATPVEEFTISILPNGSSRAILRLEWGTFQWTAPITLEHSSTGR